MASVIVLGQYAYGVTSLKGAKPVSYTHLMQPGEEMGKMLEAAHRLRLAGVGKEAALRQLHV